MFPWRKLTCRKSILNERRTPRVMDDRRSPVHVGSQWNLLPITRFWIVHHVAQPVGVSFGAIAGIEVIGGFELFCSAWQFCERLPTHRAPTRASTSRLRHGRTLILLSPDHF